MKKVEMEQKINQLEQKIVDMETIKYRTEIEKHRSGYIHIPWSSAGFGRMMLCWGCYHPHSGSHVYYKPKNHSKQG